MESLDTRADFEHRSLAVAHPIPISTSRRLFSKKPRGSARFLPLVFLLALGACQGEKKKDDAKPQAPAKVSTEKVKAQDFVEKLTFFADVRARAEASLSGEQAGRVVKVHVREGDHVKEGQLLVELDDQLARAELSEAVAQNKQAKAQESQAELEVERYQTMRQEKAVSDLEALRKESEAKTYQAASQGQRARVARGSELVKRFRITAPFSGVVTERAVDPGDWLSVGSLALKLLTNDRLEVDVQVPERVLASLPRVEKIIIRSADHEVEATVDGAVDALDPQTRTALLRLIPSEKTEYLRSGAAVHADFYLHRTDGIVIPRDAIVHGIGSDRVFSVVEGKAVPIEIEVISTSQEFALITEGGVHLGDELITRGNERLRPGQLVSTSGAIIPKGDGT